MLEQEARSFAVVAEALQKGGGAMGQKLLLAKDGTTGATIGTITDEPKHEVCKRR